MGTKFESGICFISSRDMISLLGEGEQGILKELKRNGAPIRGDEGSLIVDSWNFNWHQISHMSFPGIYFSWHPIDKNTISID